MDISKRDKYDFVVNSLLDDKVLKHPKHDDSLPSNMVGADIVIGLSVQG